MVGKETADIAGDAGFDNLAPNTADGKFVDITGLNHFIDIFAHVHWPALTVAGTIGVAAAAGVVIGGANLLVVGDEVWIAFKEIGLEGTNGFLKKFPLKIELFTIT